ncbi:MAG: O-antigen ligase C-terminal domain-containing protein [Burkholderiales bacterium]|nr:O-antigen ligase C-terminal domain-containing protein [Burkholderiales bacterium]
MAALMLAGCAYAAWDYWRISQIYLPVDERSSHYRDNTMDKLRKSLAISEPSAVRGTNHHKPDRR